MSGNSSVGSLLRLSSLTALALILQSAPPVNAEEVKAGLWKGIIYKVPMNECAQPLLPNTVAAKEDVERINEEIDKFRECLTAHHDKLDAGFETIKKAFSLARTDREAVKLNRKLEEINAATSQTNEMRKKFDNNLALHNIKVEAGNKKRAK